MHFGPAIHAFGREPPLSTGQRLWTDARFVHSGASVSQESKPQGDWTDAGQPMVGPHASGPPMTPPRPSTLCNVEGKTNIWGMFLSECMRYVKAW